MHLNRIPEACYSHHTMSSPNRGDICSELTTLNYQVVTITTKLYTQGNFMLCRSREVDRSSSSVAPPWSIYYLLLPKRFGCNHMHAATRFVGATWTTSIPQSCKLYHSMRSSVRGVLLAAVVCIGANALYGGRDDVIQISGAKDFREKVVKSPSVSIVEFYAPVRYSSRYAAITACTPCWPSLLDRQ